MGSGLSRPASGSAPEVWQLSTSRDFNSALQSKPETDISRQQSLELEVQARVAAELKRIRAEEADALKDAQKKLSEAEEANNDGGITRYAVSKEVEALRAKLDERKKVRQLPDNLEAARSEVVRCLREHDRRPLDCWKEVEAFKEEVRRLEKGWVDTVAR